MVQKKRDTWRAKINGKRKYYTVQKGAERGNVVKGKNVIVRKPRRENRKS